MNKAYNLKRDLASIVAEMHGVSPDYVRKVMRCERENEAIVQTYMEMLEGKTKLIQAVKNLVPFD